MRDKGPILVIDDGRLPGLVASLMAQDRSLVSTLVPPMSDDAAPARRRALQRRVDLLTLGPVHELPRLAGPAGPLDEARMLLAAAAVAVDLGFARLVWPVNRADDFDALAQTGDRLRLADALLAVDAPSLAIESPLLDLTDAQLADLARDMDAPLAAWWPCSKAGDQPCLRCQDCRKWGALVNPPREARTPALA